MEQRKKFIHRNNISVDRRKTNPKLNELIDILLEEGYIDTFTHNGEIVKISKEETTPLQNGQFTNRNNISVGRQKINPKLDKKLIHRNNIPIDQKKTTPKSIEITTE